MKKSKLEFDVLPSLLFGTMVVLLAVASGIFAFYAWGAFVTAIYPAGFTLAALAIFTGAAAIYLLYEVFLVFGDWISTLNSESEI